MKTELIANFQHYTSERFESVFNIYLAIYVLVALGLNGINACYTVISFWIRSRNSDVPSCVKRLFLQILAYPILCKCIQIKVDPDFDKMEKRTKTLYSNLNEWTESGSDHNTKQSRCSLFFIEQYSVQI